MYRNNENESTTKKKTTNENNAGGYNSTIYDFILFRMAKASESNETKKKNNQIVVLITSVLCASDDNIVPLCWVKNTVSQINMLKCVICCCCCFFLLAHFNSIFTVSFSLCRMLNTFKWLFWISFISLLVSFHSYLCSTEMIFAYLCYDNGCSNIWPNNDNMSSL